jgi:hypothetical protein
LPRTALILIRLTRRTQRLPGRSSGYGPRSRGRLRLWSSRCDRCRTSCGSAWRLRCRSGRCRGCRRNWFGGSRSCDSWCSRCCQSRCRRGGRCSLRLRCGGGSRRRKRRSGHSGLYRNWCGSGGSGGRRCGSRRRCSCHWRGGRSSRCRRSRPLAHGSGTYIASLSLGGCGAFRGNVSLRLPLNRAANFLSYVHRDRTGVSLFFRDAEARQKVDDGLCFDFELTGQLVDSNLISVGHAFRSGHLLSGIRLVVFFGNFAAFISRLRFDVRLAGIFGRQLRRDFIISGRFRR